MRIALAVVFSLASFVALAADEDVKLVKSDGTIEISIGDEPFALTNTHAGCGSSWVQWGGCQ